MVYKISAAAAFIFMAFTGHVVAQAPGSSPEIQPAVIKTSPAPPVSPISTPSITGPRTSPSKSRFPSSPPANPPAHHVVEGSLGSPLSSPPSPPSDDTTSTADSSPSPLPPSLKKSRASVHTIGVSTVAIAGVIASSFFMS